MRKVKKYFNRTLRGKSVSNKGGIKHATTFVNTRPRVTSENVYHDKGKIHTSKYPENEPGPSVQAESSSKNSHEKLFTKQTAATAPAPSVKKSSKCEVRKCRALKATELTAEADNNIKLQRLIVKVKELKKNIQEYGIIKDTEKCTEDILKKSATSQTQGESVDSIASVLITLEYCKNQIIRMEEFFKNKNYWKKIQDKRQMCCDIATPHVHTFVDGLSAVIKFTVEERQPAVTCDNDKPSTSCPIELIEHENRVSFCEHSDDQLRVVPQTITTAVLLEKSGEISRSESFISANAPWIKKKP